MKKHYAMWTVMAMLVFAATCAAQEQIVLSRMKGEPTIHTLMGERVLREAYARIGVELDFEVLPALRALAYANTGQTDGEFLRLSGLETSYPNLIMLPIPIAEEDVMVYTKDVEFTVEGWPSLSPYTIGYLRGFKLAELKTQGMTVEMVNSVQQAFRKLATGRTDVVVDLRSGQCVLHALDLPAIKLLEPPLERVILYHYLHKRHTALAAKLEEVLREMDREGELTTIQETALQDFLKDCQ